MTVAEASRFRNVDVDAHLLEICEVQRLASPPGRSLYGEQSLRTEV